MRALFSFAIAIGFASHLTATAQVPDAGTAGTGVDLSGIYEAPVFVAVVEVSEPDAYPFTAAAKHAFDAYDALTVAPNQIDDCTPETMPGILWSNNPMEITQENDRIIMHFERGGTIRSIPVDGAPPSSDHPVSELGYSVARWEGDVLIIETTHMMSGSLRNNRGYPISHEARLTERYWREPGANDLQMELLIDDRSNYTETFTLGRRWIWAPDDEIQLWVCVNLGPRDAESPDIDELARMLEEL